MPTNPLAISTGMNQGEAQVLNIPQSNYYADKLAQAKKADADVANDIGTTLAKTPWTYDMPEFKQLQSDIRTFVKDNRAALVKGDFDAKMQLEQMKQDYLNRYEESKNAEKHYNKMTGYYLSNQDRYYDKDYEKMTALAQQGSKAYDSAAVRLRKNFKATDFNDDLIKQLKAIPTTATGAHLEDIKDEETGKSYTYMVSGDRNSKVKLTDVANAIYDGYAADFTEEQMNDKNQSREKVTAFAENFLRSELKYSQPYDAEARKSSSGFDYDNFDLTNLNYSTPGTININSPGYSEKDNLISLGDFQTIDPYGAAGAGTTGEKITLPNTEGLIVLKVSDNGIPLAGGAKLRQKKTYSPAEYDPVSKSLTNTELKLVNAIYSPVTTESKSKSIATVGLPLSQQTAKKLVGEDKIKTKDAFTGIFKDDDGNEFAKPINKAFVDAFRDQSSSNAKYKEFLSYMYKLYAPAKLRNDPIIETLGLTEKEINLFNRALNLNNNNVSSGSERPMPKTKAQKAAEKAK